MGATYKYFSVSYRNAYPFYNWMLLQAGVLGLNATFFYSAMLDADLLLFGIGELVVFLGIQFMMFLRWRQFLKEYPAVSIRCSKKESCDLFGKWFDDRDFAHGRKYRQHVENVIFVLAVVVYEVLYLVACR